MTLSTADPTTWPQLTGTLLRREHLDREQTAWAMDQVMSGNATPVQLAGFLIALRAKGETIEELAGLADVMLRKAIRIKVPGPAVDIVGTGGDRLHTVNISTMAAVVVAGTGRRVVKHGNRAASSSSGAADVLEALGVRLDLTPERVAALAVEAGITFCFAQRFHPGFRHAAVARGELGLPTAFNFLGPLTNPAQSEAAAVGVGDARMAPLMAGVLADRGISALVFHGDDGLDEMSPTAPTQVWQVSAGTVEHQVVDAVSDLGLPRCTIADLRGGDAAHNAGVFRDVLGGQPGPIRDAVLLNAAAGLVATGLGTGTLVERLAVGLAEAAESIDSGAAAELLGRWVAASSAETE